MIASTFSLAMHILATSLKLVGPVKQVFNYVLPYSRNMSTKINQKVNFNSKHLRKGDPLPPFNGKLRIYNMRYCPYAHRTILALIAKDIDYEVVNINLLDKPEWFPSKSIFGKVPALEIQDGLTICESLVTTEYLDDVYPERPLLSKDPIRKAQDKIIVEAVGPILGAFYRNIRGVEPLTEEILAAYHKALKFLEDQLVSRGTTFFGGELPGYADYMIWPWFERIVTLDNEVPDLKIESVKYTHFSKYIDNMLRDPTVASYIVSADILKQVLNGYKPGNTPNYDLLIED